MKRTHARPRPRPLARRGRTVAVRSLAVVFAGAAWVGCAPGASDEANGGAPESFTVEFETSAGPFAIEFVRAWSPAAVDRAYELALQGYWRGARIYRVNERYAQFGYSGVPDADARWIRRGVPDEPSQASNVRGSVSFARGGPGTRSAILFINRSDNSDLDALAWNGVVGFPPVGRVVRGMDAVDRLFSGYGDEPMQWEDSIEAVGNAFLDRAYPELDSIIGLRVEGAGG